MVFCWGLCSALWGGTHRTHLVQYGPVHFTSHHLASFLHRLWMSLGCYMLPLGSIWSLICPKIRCSRLISPTDLMQLPFRPWPLASIVSTAFRGQSIPNRCWNGMTRAGWTWMASGSSAFAPWHGSTLGSGRATLKCHSACNHLCLEHWGNWVPSARDLDLLKSCGFSFAYVTEFWMDPHGVTHTLFWISIGYHSHYSSSNHIHHSRNPLGNPWKPQFFLGSCMVLPISSLHISGMN